MDNRHRKLFIAKQPKECKFRPKMHPNTSGSCAPPGPAGEVMRSPRPLAAMKDLLLRRGRAGGLLLRGTEAKKGDGKGIPPTMSRINTVYRTFLNQLMSVGKSNALSDNLTFKLQVQCHLQARRQEMKWVFFCKKVENGGGRFL